MTDGRTIVFLGPSLPLNLAQKLLVAEYKPPAKQSEIFSIVRASPPGVIVLIDGEFHQSLSVWHKEILFAMAEGVLVVGASSMGALRAAELHALGMVGIGNIFNAYRDGMIIADDEVALTYGPAELSYPQITVPLVNVRATLKAAESCGYITTEQTQFLLARFQSIHFSQRTRLEMREEMLKCGFKPEDFQNIFVENFIDQKRLDAIEALKFAGCLGCDQVNKGRNNKVAKTHSLNVLDQQDRITEDGFRRREIAKYISISQDNFENTLANSLNRSIAILFGKMTSVSPTEDQVHYQEKIFRERFSIVDEAEFARWLRRNDLRYEDFKRLMRENAVCNKIYRWLSSMAGAREHTQSILDYMTLENSYTTWKEELSSNRDFAKISFPNASGEENSLADRPLHDILAMHSKHHPRLTYQSIENWMKDVGFQSTDDLKHELTKLVLSDGAKRNFIEGIIDLNTAEAK